MTDSRVYNCGRGCIRLISKHSAVLCEGFLSRVPKNVIGGSRESPTYTTGRRTKRYLGNCIIRSKHFIHQGPNAMDILVSDLNEDAAAFRQQIPRHGQPIPQIRQIRMNPIPPSIPERLHLLRLAADVLRLAVLHVAARRRPLEVRVELDAVGRVEVDALHLAAQPLALGQRRHHLEAVAENHPVRPVGVVLVELGPGALVGQAVEVGEQVGLGLPRGVLAVAAPVLGPAPQVVDEDLGVDLLLDVEGRRLHDEVGPVLIVLAAPDELRIEVAVAALVGDPDRALLGPAHHRPVLGGRDVLPRRLAVGEALDLPGRLALPLGHIRPTARIPRFARSSSGVSADRASGPYRRAGYGNASGDARLHVDVMAAVDSPQLPAPRFEKRGESFAGDRLHTAISITLSVSDRGICCTSTERQPSTAS